MDAAFQRSVRDRADHRYEYCRVPQIAYRKRFHLDHIISRQHGGLTHGENLALACLDCNLNKGPNVAGIDPIDGAVTPLFNPRVDRWDVHFEWIGPEIRGRTPTGRATVGVLNLNDAQRLRVRRGLFEEGLMPAAEPG